jgi:hypothetical protein
MLPHTLSAQSSIERHVWQDARSFAPISRTASAITGAITLSGNPEFATEGSSTGLIFGDDAAVNLTSQDASWRTWDVGGQGKQTAEVFRLSDDPGPLQNGNTLCGGGNPEPLYAVFYEQSLFGGDPTLTMAVFQSIEPPFDINSSGLCGTFTYEIGTGANEAGVSVEPVVLADEGEGFGACTCGQKRTQLMTRRQLRCRLLLRLARRDPEPPLPSSRDANPTRQRHTSSGAISLVTIPAMCIRNGSASQSGSARGKRERCGGGCPLTVTLPLPLVGLGTS